MRGKISIAVWNLIAFAFWGLMIADKPARWVTVAAVVLPLQLLINVGILSCTKLFRVTGLTVIFLVGFFAGLYRAVRDGLWWEFILLVVPLMLIAWSVRAHRQRLLRELR